MPLRIGDANIRSGRGVFHTAGTASGTLLFKLTPWIVVGLFVLGATTALYFKFRAPRRYDLIGRIVYEDNVVRD